MSTAEPRVDAYIAHAAAFAQPLLLVLRRRVHSDRGAATGALATVPAPKATVGGFTPRYQRDVVEWIGETSRDRTRQPRIALTIGWLSDGKRRNLKHQTH